ncbi:MAG: glutamate--tRNA ligase [Planctomycetota bacterium]|nr:glutamate--tRNA ligase [Planctomycetota bacterium]
MPEPVAVRAAPSPTGDPHVGTAYVCLFNYALRQKRGGRFILRIDDTDRTRYNADSERNILRELQWLGISCDEGPSQGGDFGPYRQSERTELYRSAVDELIAKGAAYRCDCTKERLDEVRAAQRARKEQPRYDGHCRERNVSSDTAHVVRLKVPREGETTFHDGLRGNITIAHSTVDDQVLLKTDGHPTYHLATVVDDHHMGITHILRAEEWINSMPKHILLYQAFGWEPPAHYHLPLLRNSDKSKISKRKNHTSITWYRENGFLPEAFLNFLALMGFSIGDDQEEFSLDEFIAAFEPDAIKTSAPVFDLTKLEWLNGVYIRKMDPAVIADRIVRVSEMAACADRELLVRIVPLIQERMKRLTEFDDLCDFFFSESVDPQYDDLIPKKRTETNTAAVLRGVRQVVAKSETLALEPLEADLRALGDEVAWKPRELFMSIRFAISGKKVTPPIIESMCLLGQAECIERLDAAIDVLGDPENPILGAPGS